MRILRVGVGSCGESMPSKLLLMSDHATHTSRGLLIPAMLFVSLVCNLTALCSPFVSLAIGLGSEASHSLVTSVSLLRNSGLWILAVLVLGFSICFPFAKLGILTWVWSGRGSSAARRRWLGRVGSLARWSLFDVFLIGILLALTNDRLLVASAPKLGLPCFIVAIILSMLAGEILHRRESAPAPPSDRKPSRVLARTLLVLAAIALGIAHGAPLLQVHSIWMADGDFSLFRFTSALFAAGAPVLGVLVVVGLVIVPWLVLISTWCLTLRSTPSAIYRHAMWWRWSMLDVFLVALLVFVLEGKAFVPSEIRVGVYLMIISLIFSTCASMLVQRWQIAPAKP